MIRRRRSFFEDFLRDVERMFEDLMELERGYFGGRDFGRVEEEIREYREPVFDAWETDDEVIVTMELPGVSKEDIDLNVTPTTLEVKAEKKEEQKKEGVYQRYERGFYTVIDLPAEVKTDDVKATYKNGVLEVRLKKAKVEKKKKVKVE